MKQRAYFLAILFAILVLFSIGHGQKRSTVPSPYKITEDLLIDSPTIMISDSIIIGSGITISLSPNAKLYVVALKGLVIGDNVKFLANGKPGLIGKNGTDRVWPAPHKDYWDAKIRGDLNKPPTGQGIEGGKGQKGSQGREIRFAVANASIGGEFIVDVSGGKGGPPGRGGQVHAYCNEHGNGQSNENGGITDTPPAGNLGIGDQGEPGLISVANIAANGEATPIFRRFQGALRPDSSVLKHHQEYASAEVRSFMFIEVKPLTYEADKDGWKKLPAP
jgi:hypothetical protein